MAGMMLGLDDSRIGLIIVIAIYYDIAIYTAIY